MNSDMVMKGIGGIIILFLMIPFFKSITRGIISFFPGKDDYKSDASPYGKIQNRGLVIFLLLLIPILLLSTQCGRL